MGTRHKTCRKRASIPCPAAIIGDCSSLEAPSLCHFHSSAAQLVRSVPGWLVQLANRNGWSGVRRHEKPRASQMEVLSSWETPLSERTAAHAASMRASSIFFLFPFSTQVPDVHASMARQWPRPTQCGPGDISILDSLPWWATINPRSVKLLLIVFASSPHNPSFVSFSCPTVF